MNFNEDCGCRESGVYKIPQTKCHVLLKLLFLVPLKLCLSQNVIHFKITNAFYLLFRLFYTSRQHLLIDIQQFLWEGEQDKQFKLKARCCSSAIYAPHLWLCPYFWVPQSHKGLLMIEYFQKM